MGGESDYTTWLDGLSEEARTLFETRREIFAPDARAALKGLYGDQAETCFSRCLAIVAEAYAARPAALARRDWERLHRPDWFQQPEMLGYTTYVDRFAGTLAGMQARLDYLRELGVTYLHLLPVTRPRTGESDGGYAVESFTETDPRLGSMADLEALAAACRARGMTLVSDFVLNHTAETHDWARRARAGAPAYRAYYHIYTDKAAVEAIETHLPEVFPTAAPGNFTWVEEMGGWVWTTFYPFQWDLNYANPAVFTEILRIMLALANRGIEVLRLDSAPFLWKRAGTDCRNQPEVHLLLRAFHAFTRIAAPGLALKAEAIVSPEHQAAYLGEGAHAGRQCQLAYHNTLMVLLWSALAEGDASRLTTTLRRMPLPPATTAWVTYIRCHDDIGWGILQADRNDDATDEEVASLSAFYAGETPGSFARGAAFQSDPARPAHGTAGMTSALAGLEAALESREEREIDLAIARILLLHALIFAFGGIPLIYMGDEIGLGNDADYADDLAKAGDARWLHRPAMDWTRAQRRSNETSVESRIFSGLRRLAEERAATPALHADTPSRALHGERREVFMMRRAGARGRLLVLANMTGEIQEVSADSVRHARFTFPLRDRIAGVEFDARTGSLALGPYQCLWLEPA